MDQILIVDDSDINLTLLKHLVARLGGCEPVLFSHPAKALEWCGQPGNLPDLAIVDYMMPDIDGLEFIRRFRAMPAHGEIPVLMITANDQRDVRYQALQGGANDFLTKPVDRTEFNARMRNMLALRQSEKLLADRALHLQTLVDEKTKQIHLQEREMIFRLSRAAEFRDPETGAHIERVAHYSELVAARLGLDGDAQRLILRAAPMHDVGKIGIPDHILLKPGRLTPEEFEIMKKHAQLGYELLQGSTSPVLEAGANIALAHHEKFDGTGYPHALKGEDIPLFGRIVAVADVFDALTSERPYKKPWPVEDARAYLQGQRGTHFDPACVDAFLARWDDALSIKDAFQDTEKILI